MNRTRAWRDPELITAAAGFIVSVSGMAATLLPSVRDVAFGLAGAVLATGILALVAYLFDRRRRTVFLSFVRSDERVARRLAADLKRRGIEVRVADEALSPGDPIEATLKDSIERSDSLVVLLSPQSRASRWMDREVDFAFQSRRKVFPVLVGDVADLPDSLRDIRSVDLTEYERGVKALADAIRGDRPVAVAHGAGR